jgi:hypothetical protein
MIRSNDTAVATFWRPMFNILAVHNVAHEYNHCPSREGGRRVYMRRWPAKFMRPDYYRDRALTLRECASRTHFQGSRDALNRTAETYEQLAALIDRQLAANRSPPQK